MSLQHLADPYKNPDDFLCYTNLRKLHELEDEPIEMEFYPKR